tara:strand:- start:2950 stop:3840 length:891 start_codon:yes stop_codon:yes gene_type:complete
MSQSTVTAANAGQDHTYQSADDLTLHYVKYSRADGVSAICLPGLSRNARDFSELATYLSATRSVICPDFRGRGASDWDSDSSHYEPSVYVGDVLTLLDLRKLERVILIGTSLGGIVSAGLCQVTSQRIAGVVLNDIGPIIDPVGLARIGKYMGTWTAWSGWDEAIATIREINKVIYPTFTDAQWREFALQTCRANPDGTVTQDCDPAIAQAMAQNQTTDLDLWPVFEALKPIPSLLIRGALSDLLSKETAAEMTERLPGLDLVTVPNRGHVPTLTEPEALSAIEAFVAKVDTLEDQ